MDYNIRHELPGRLRLRTAEHRLTAELANALEHELAERCPCLSHAEVSPTNGTVLLCFPPEQRGEVLAAVSAVDVSSLSPLPLQGAALMRHEDASFMGRLGMVLLRQMLMRLVMPAWLTLPMALLRFRPYLFQGIRSLCQGCVAVPLLDAVSIGMGIATKSYSAANSIMFLLGISDMLQEHVLNKTRHALSDSLSLRLDRVWLLRGETEVSVRIEEVQPGDLLVVRTGSMIPADGVVERGEAEVNEASMTGESAPAIKRPGLMVYAGTTLVHGTLVLKVHALNAETRISRIMQLIDHAEGLKAKVQTEAEHLADRIVPFSLLTAAFTWCLTRQVQRTLSVLMVDYSCALKLSTPISVNAAMKEAISHGVVIKGGKYLEALAEADTIVFDKTGTLTTAEPTVDKVLVFGGLGEEEVLRTAACIEEHFPHSMARAIVAEAGRRHLGHEEEHAEVQFVVAHGVHTTIHGVPAIVGSAHYIFEDEGVPVTEEQREYIRRESEGRSVIYLAVGGHLEGCICLRDTLRPEAPAVIAALRAAGVQQIVMLTGDGQEAAALVAQQLGIDEYRAQVLPEDKAGIIRELKKQGRRVIMCGDGVNDSPAMSVADVAISMKDAADLAREVSDITLLNHSLESLVQLRRLSRATMERIRGNYRFIAGFNSGLILLGATGVLSPVRSAYLHNASTVAVCAASARPLLEKQQKGV